MSTLEARTRATRAWRARSSAKPMQVYLHVDTLAQLDALVEARGAPSRGAVLSELIEAAYEALNAPARPMPEAPAVIAPARTWKLVKSKAHGWRWDVLIDGKVVGRMKPPEIKGGDWVGETAALPGAEHRRYRRTRDELARLLVDLAG